VAFGLRLKNCIFDALLQQLKCYDPHPSSHNFIFYSHRLDALEAAEEAHLEFLRSIAQKEAPDPVGMATTASHPNTSSASQHPPSQFGVPPTDPVEMSVYPEPTGVGGRTRFWNQPRTPAPPGASFTSPAPTRRMDVQSTLS
jgi:hypothetical protein